MQANNRLWANQLAKSYKKRAVVQGVNVEVNSGEIVGLLGPNGAGKTTTFYMIVGLVRSDKGNIGLNDQDLTKLPMHARAHQGVGYLPQEASVFRGLTVEENEKRIVRNAIKKGFVSVDHNLIARNKE